MYAADSVEKSPQPTPIKRVMNFSRTINRIVFNGDSQLMTITSRQQKNELKLVCFVSLQCLIDTEQIHTGTMSVYQNWPNQKTPLHYVSDIAFSPNSGFLAVANARGKVLLYRIHHYASA
jgi:U3 small nucleolar RNA-associated protein 18